MVSAVVTKEAGGLVLVTSFKHHEVELYYQFVCSLEPLKLDTIDGLECFCQVLIGALAWQGKLQIVNCNLQVPPYNVAYRQCLYFISL